MAALVSAEATCDRARFASFAVASLRSFSSVSRRFAIVFSAVCSRSLSRLRRDWISRLASACDAPSSSRMPSAVLLLFSAAFAARVASASASRSCELRRRSFPSSSDTLRRKDAISFLASRSLTVLSLLADCAASPPLAISVSSRLSSSMVSSASRSRASHSASTCATTAEASAEASFPPRDEDAPPASSRAARRSSFSFWRAPLMTVRVATFFRSDSVSEDIVGALSPSVAARPSLCRFAHE